MKNEKYGWRGCGGNVGSRAIYHADGAPLKKYSQGTTKKPIICAIIYITIDNRKGGVGYV